MPAGGGAVAGAWPAAPARGVARCQCMRAIRCRNANNGIPTPQDVLYRSLSAQRRSQWFSRSAVCYVRVSARQVTRQMVTVAAPAVFRLDHTSPYHPPTMLSSPYGAVRCPPSSAAAVAFRPAAIWREEQAGMREQAVVVLAGMRGRVTCLYTPRCLRDEWRALLNDGGERGQRVWSPSPNEEYRPLRARPTRQERRTVAAQRSVAGDIRFIPVARREITISLY